VRAVVQRVYDAAVTVDGAVTGSVKQGLLVYLGVASDDTEADCRWMCGKVAELRIFSDETGRMNRDVREVRGGILLVSQFTLLADARKGRRPDYSGAAKGEQARLLYEKCIDLFRERDMPVECGVFGAEMKVSSVNDGPVTIILDSCRGC
jgi:D-tyrosyl-tRNA(Tyr) deacylase